MTAPSTRSASVAVGLVAVACVQGVLWWAYYGFATKALVGDEYRYRAAALALWQGLPVPPNFIWPPLQKWFLAPLIGPMQGGLVLAQVVQMLLLGACALLLRQIWLQLDPRPLAANLAGLLFATSPSIMAYGFYLWPEPLHLALLVGAIWLLVTRASNAFAAAGGGVMIGLALLAKSLLSGFWPLFLLLFVRRPWFRSLWWSAAVFVLAVVAVTAPATLRGWQATGKPLIADSSMYNLYVGLKGSQRSDYIRDRGGIIMREYLAAGDTPRQRSAAFKQRIIEHIDENGILPVLGHQLGFQYFRLFNAKRTLVSQLPGPACAGYTSAYVVPAHWATGIRIAAETHYALVLIAAAFGVALWRRPHPLLWLLALFFVYQFALYLGLHVKARFLLPMLPFLCGFAASALASFATSRWPTPLALPGRDELSANGVSAPPLTRWRWTIAFSLAALLLILAFAGPWLDQSCG